MANGKINTKAKDLKIECTDTKKSKLYDFLDKKLILYFYPKDLTPGCTTESIEFKRSTPCLDQSDKSLFVLSPAG